MPDLYGVRDVSVVLGEHVALDHVCLEIRPGSVTAVVGGDGAGKTTLLRTLCGRVRPTTGQVSAPPQERIGFQPATSGTWANLSVSENLDVVAGSYRIPAARARQRAAELLAAAGLTDARDRLASQLSGGMRQKLGVCMALLAEPDLLVLDEPTTGVDPVSRVELSALIADAAARGAAVVMATTYVDEAARAQNALVLDAGVPLAQGAPVEVLDAAPGTVTAVDRPDNPRLAWRRGRALHAWHPGSPARGEKPVPLDLEDAVIAAALAHRGDGEEPLPASGTHRVVERTELVRADGLSRAFGDHVAVRDVSLLVRPGEIVGLIGANGAGKTTLIRMLLGLLTPSAGTVELMGKPPGREGRKLVGYVPQGLGLYGDLTVAENLDFAASAYNATPPHYAQLDAIRDDLVGSLGLGQQRLAAFASVLAHAPELLILDEPTSGVDPLARARLWDTIHAEADAGTGVIVSTHYMQEAEQCDRLILLDLGRVVAEGSASDIVGDARAWRVCTHTWGDAFAALRAANMAVALAGPDVRVVDATRAQVSETLQAAGVDAELDEVPATLEETMTAIVRARAAA